MYYAHHLIRCIFRPKNMNKDAKVSVPCMFVFIFTSLLPVLSSVHLGALHRTESVLIDLSDGHGQKHSEQLRSSPTPGACMLQSTLVDM